jgi:hypothetical protein
MADWSLKSLLPQGTITYEGGSRRLTINLVLASSRLNQRVTRCHIHPVKHGSDHRAIETTFQIEVQPAPLPKTHYLFREAPWAKINNELRGLQTEIVDITNCLELESAVKYLTKKISQAVR